jgi:hypothetical protein
LPPCFSKESGLEGYDLDAKVTPREIRIKKKEDKF